MIIPYKDENPVNKRPYITIILLATNLLVYLASVKYPGGLEGLRITSLDGPQPSSLSSAPCSFTVASFT
jgi:hypothetical protein